ncbi:MAG: AMP-binding protein [Caldithrix sp.]|nr:AMP-binding protein [Caldithrix sp.]
MDALTLKNVLENSTEKFALRPALGRVDGETLTYAVLYNRVQALSQYLIDQNFRKGDRIAILSENKPNWPIVYFAITSIGLIAVPIQPEFQENEIKHILRHAGVSGLFASKGQMDKIGDRDDHKIKVCIDIDTFRPFDTHKKRSPALLNLLKRSENEISKIREAAFTVSESQSYKVEEQDIASIIYTSGTTGHSKGVVLTHKNIVFDAKVGKKIIDVDEHDRLLSVLPLAHTYECTIGLIAPIIYGASVYYLGKTPTPRILMPALQSVKPTIILTVPLIIEKIYKKRVYPIITKNKFVESITRIHFLRNRLYKLIGKRLLASFGGELKAFGIGGAALLPEVEKFLRYAQFPYAVGYGLTESSPLSLAAGVRETRFRSAGKPIENVEVMIKAPDKNTGVGELLIRGPNIMQGYYKDEQRTAEVLDEEGWLYTGDLACIDDDGYVFIKGRIKNVIIGSNGKNIYPEEIESVINENEYVLESIVFEDEDKLYARVCLDYELIDEQFKNQSYSENALRKQIDIILQNIQNYTNDRIPKYARLHRLIEQTEPFIKTPTQKIKRFLYVNDPQ